MTKRSKTAAEQHLNNGDALVTAQPGTVRVAGQPAKAAALNLMADQLEHLLDAQTDEWRRQWGGIIARVIAEYRTRTGAPPTKQKAAVKHVEDRVNALDDPTVPIPLQWIHESSEETRYSVERLKKELRKKGYKIASVRHK